MITLTSDQAFSAARAVEVRRDALIESAARAWVQDTDDPTEVVLAIFGSSDPIDPEVNLAAYEKSYCEDEALYCTLMDLDFDVRTGEQFRYWVTEAANRILNRRVREGGELTPVQAALASQDFGRV
jgi:hypothetical protein